jgi:hypothetical protein
MEHNALSSEEQAQPTKRTQREEKRKREEKKRKPEEKKRKRVERTEVSNPHEAVSSEDPARAAALSGTD